jgi:hypothetical protein
MMSTNHIRHSIPMAAHVKAPAIELEAHGINGRLSLVVHGADSGKGLSAPKSQFLF